MPEKARKIGGGNYFQSAPQKKSKTPQETEEAVKNIEAGQDNGSDGDEISASGMEDSGAFDLAAAQAALNDLTSDPMTATSDSISEDLDISGDISDEKENTSGGFINITIPPELISDDNQTSDEEPDDEPDESGDEEITEEPSEENTQEDSAYIPETVGYEPAAAEDLPSREENEPLDEPSDDAAVIAPAAESDAVPAAEKVPDVSDDIPDDDVISDDDTPAPAEKPSDVSGDVPSAPVISPFLIAAAEAAQAEKAAEGIGAAEAGEKDAGKTGRTDKDQKTSYKLGPVIGITAAALFFGAIAFGSTNYVYRHMPLGLNTHIRSAETSYSASARNSAVDGLNDDITFSYSVEGAAMKSHTSGKITVGEFIRSIGDELKHESSDGEKWEYASNYPNSTVLEDGMEVKIDLVSSKTVTSTDVLKYSTEVIGTEDLPKGERVVLRSGIDGLVRRVYSQKFVNGEMIANDITEQEIIAEPQSEVVYEGVGGVFVSPTTGKSYEYLYYIDCEATAYGVDTGFGGDSPWAYSGKLIEIGDIAVDPEVIPLKTKCYVYCDEYDIGYCSAEDIGGAIKGNKIDIYMGKDYEAQKQFGRRQVRVYILELPEENGG